MTKYYRITDLDLIGKQTGMFDCFIYDPALGWQKDTDNRLMDRIMGYDGDSIGSLQIIGTLEEITENRAIELIRRLSEKT